MDLKCLTFVLFIILITLMISCFTSLNFKVFQSYSFTRILSMSDDHTIFLEKNMHSSGKDTFDITNKQNSNSVFSEIQSIDSKGSLILNEIPKNNNNELNSYKISDFDIKNSSSHSSSFNIKLPVHNNNNQYTMVTKTSHLVYNHLSTVTSNGTMGRYSLYSSTRDMLQNIYKEARMNLTYRQTYVKEEFKNKYILVYGTTVLFSEDSTRQELQNSCIDGMLYLQKYYPIKYVVFEQNPIIIKYLEGLGFDVCSDYEHNEYNIPTLRGIFKYIESHYDSDFYGYINGDIIQSSYIFDLLYKLNKMKLNHEIASDIFMVGRRHNFYYKVLIPIQKHVKEYDVLVKFCYLNGHIESIWGMDYFISTKGVLTKKPFDEVVIGRKRVDNYILAYVNAKSDYFTTIDLSDYLMTIHLSNSDIHKSFQTEEDKLYNIYLLIKKHKSDLIHGLTTSAHYKTFMGKNSRLIIQNMKLNDTDIIRTNQNILKDVL